MEPQHRILLTCLFLAIIPAMTGCENLIKPWTDLPSENAPWCAPQKRAIQQERIVSNTLLPFHRYERQWLGDARVVIPDLFYKKLNAYMASHFDWRNWPDSNMWIGSVLQKESPYMFALVSFNPGVVVYWDAKNFHWGYGDSSNAVGGIADTRAVVMATTDVAPAEKLWCFLPDLDVAPREMEMVTEGKGRISIPGGELLFEKTLSGWQVTRR